MVQMECVDLEGDFALRQRVLLRLLMLLSMGFDPCTDAGGRVVGVKQDSVKREGPRANEA